MITQDTLLAQLLRLVDHIPTPLPPARRPPGRPIVYSDRLFLKALLIMIARRLHKVGELLALLEEPTPEMRLVRSLLSEEGRFPSRRTFERRQGIASDVARADRLFGTVLGRAAQAVGELGTGGGVGL